MTIAKIRNLSQAGVITDIDPYNLPANAFSMAVNARFQAASIVRAPVFRRVPLTLSNTGPRFLTSSILQVGFDTVYIGYLNGRVTGVVNSVETDQSIFAYVNSNAETPYTAQFLQNVLYVNRADRDPWFLRVADSVFQDMGVATPLWNSGTTYAINSLVTGSDNFVYISLQNTNLNHDPTTDTNHVWWIKTGKPWDPTWRANLIRQCGGALVALAFTKGATFFPTGVKTSEFAQINATPFTWDSNDPTNNATENELGDMRSQIVEAQNLGQALIIYALSETWAMQADGSVEVFNYTRLFNDRGCISPNCVVEVDKKHYVFGPNDIWIHDGISKQSICDLKTHNFIFGSINLATANRFHVIHDPNRKEVRFNYISGDAFLGFPVVDGCNRCAVYNLVENTWTFDDLPYVYGMTVANIDTVLTYNTVATTYDMTGGSYNDQDDSEKRVLIALGDANTAANTALSLYAVDLQGPGSIIAYAVDLNATLGVSLFRDGIDLDEMPEVADNRGYKVLSSIFPQARFESGAGPLMFSVGGADNYNDPVTLSAPMSYDGVTSVRCDFYSPGRFLFIEIIYNDFHYFNLTGLDLDLVVTGQE